MLVPNLSVAKPDYRGGSIVNLMSTIKAGFDLDPGEYPPLRVLPVERIRAAERVVLLIIDGLGADILEQFAESSSRSSVLFENRGHKITSVYPPTTASAITTFMSGQAPQQHALTGWFMHLREIGSVAAILPFMTRLGGVQLTQLGVAIEDVIDCPNIFDVFGSSTTMLMPEAIIDSDFSRLMGGTSERLAYSDLGNFAQQLTEICGGTGDAAFTYAYWSDFDHLSHVHGPSSEIVEQHFWELDRALAPVVESCANAGTLLLITADHGFLDSGPAERIDLEQHPELSAMLATPLFGEPRSAYCCVRKGSELSFEDYIRSELADEVKLSPSQQLIEEDWFGLGTAHPKLHTRLGDYTLQMRERFTISDRLLGERPFDLRGMHGGMTSSEQWVPLIVAG